MSGLLQKIKTWHGKEHIYPGYDWQVLLFSESLLVFILAIFAFYFYIQIYQGKIFNPSDDGKTSQVSIDKNLLEKTVSDVKSREARFNEIKENKLNFPDPSL